MSSNREKLLTFIVFVLLLGFIASMWAGKQEVTEYKKAYSECKDAYTMAENGRLPLWTYQNLTNITFNEGSLVGELK